MVCIVCEVLIRRVSTILCLLMICIQNPGRIGRKTVGWLVRGGEAGGEGVGVGVSKYTLEVILYSFFPLKNTYQIEHIKDTEHSEHIRNRDFRQSLY
jgi:hypothetical protein